MTNYFWTPRRYSSRMADRIGPRKALRVYLSEWREYYELTQTQVADRVGTDKGTISKWEKGARSGKIGTAQMGAYAEALGRRAKEMLSPPRAGKTLDEMAEELGLDRDSAETALKIMSRKAS